MLRVVQNPADMAEIISLKVGRPEKLRVHLIINKGLRVRNSQSFKVFEHDALLFFLYARLDTSSRLDLFCSDVKLGSVYTALVGELRVVTI